MGLEASQFRRLSARLTGFAISRGLDSADAEDCAQETLLVLARKYADKDEADAVPLAFRIMRWKISEHRRRQVARRESVSVAVDDVQLKDGGMGANPEEVVALQEAVHAALGRLGRKCRELLLWQLEGLSGEEIANKLNLPTRNAAYIAINRCKKSFKQAYEALRKPPFGRT
ncbi:MAG: sigma-70 family RNA polymerase sigma factor [Bryobacterales bacterium]|nr:sigma-70 family RNA polymerase sigma factor [Bryobacterales bacterium]